MGEPSGPARPAQPKRRLGRRRSGQQHPRPGGVPLRLGGWSGLQGSGDPGLDADLRANGRAQHKLWVGLFSIDLDDSGTLWGHDGYGNSFMYYWPEQGIAFTGTLNQTENDWWPMVEAAVSRLSP